MQLCLNSNLEQMELGKQGLQIFVLLLEGSYYSLVLLIGPPTVTYVDATISGLR
ncbi:TPA: hypothetical protein ACH3X3_010144 [Trebouxia sp. C0006]